MPISNSRTALSLDRNELAKFLACAEALERRTRVAGVGKRGCEGMLRRSGLAVLRALVLQFRSRRNGRAWPAVETLAEMANVSRSAAHEALNRLERAGFLARQAQSRLGGVFDRRGRLVPMRAPSLIAFYWPQMFFPGESRNATRPTLALKYKKGESGWPKRPGKLAAVQAMQTWLNDRDQARDRVRAADRAAAEAETLAAIAAMRARGEI